MTSPQPRTTRPAASFDKLPTALRAQINALVKVGDQFEQAAYGAWGVAKTLVSLLELLLDLMIAWAIEAAATRRPPSPSASCRRR